MMTTRLYVSVLPLTAAVLLVFFACVVARPSDAVGRVGVPRRRFVRDLPVTPAVSDPGPNSHRDSNDNAEPSTQKPGTAVIACNDSAAGGNTTTTCKPASTDVGTGGFVDGVEQFVSKNQSVIMRALIVFGSITAIVLIYVSFRCIRRYRQQSKSRKYGLISMPDDKLELRPLDEDDDDDEDMTVFDRTKPRNLNSSGGHGNSSGGNRPMKPLVKRPR